MKDICEEITRLTKDKHPLYYSKVNIRFQNAVAWEKDGVNRVMKGIEMSDLISILSPKYPIISTFLNRRQIDLIRILLLEFMCNRDMTLSRKELCDKLGFFSVNEVSRLVNSIKKYCYTCPFDRCDEQLSFLDAGEFDVLAHEKIFYFDLDFLWKTLAHIQTHYDNNDSTIWDIATPKERKEFQKYVPKHRRRQSKQKFVMTQPPEIKINVPKNNCERPF
jgi:hypothetical protein